LPAPSESTARRDKRTAILDAAIRVFARTGYHGARVSDIAEEAGIAYGLVYHYFKNKEEVLKTIFEERWGGFLDVVEAIAASEASTREKLENVARLILNAYRVRPEWVKVLVLEIQRSSRFAEPGQIHAVGKLFQTIAGILRAGQRAGEIRADLDPEIACYVLIGGLEIVITALVLDVIEIERGQSESEYFDRVAGTVVETLVNGMATESKE
jgi:TetR/AcrR family fatty acid metabolism transcriptional regulator